MKLYNRVKEFLFPKTDGVVQEGTPLIIKKEEVTMATKKAPTKKAPAKKAPATKAPAKKAPVKKTTKKK